MSRGVKILIGIVATLVLVFLIGAVLCTVVFAPVRSTGAESGAEIIGSSEEIGLPNPAAVYCEEQGGRVEIRTAAGGGQYGICIFPDGSECDDWALYRDECSPGQ
jgi:putative hemolysin